MVQRSKCKDRPGLIPIARFVFGQKNIHLAHLAHLARQATSSLVVRGALGPFHEHRIVAARSKKLSAGEIP